MNDHDLKEVDAHAEIVMHRYMDHLYEKALPKIIAAVLTAHDNDCRAHGAVAKRVDRLRFIVIGLVIGVGIGGSVGAGEALAKLLFGL